MSKEEGIIFNPEKKEIISKNNYLDRSLEDILEENKKARRTEGSKSTRRGKRQRTEGSKNRRGTDSKKSSRPNRKETRKEKPSKPSLKKNIDIKVPEATLQDILKDIGVDTEGYSLRLVATKKK
ncbi:hypothetical protein M9Y10_034085 [Tritrichomonas musculus]|uniref:Uncharacterized protein n=1 Tax=Tritrichomonas musculus TaxID=1915356 RepID=A0ABR2KE43_9EUKA